MVGAVRTRHQYTRWQWDRVEGGLRRRDVCRVPEGIQSIPGEWPGCGGREWPVYHSEGIQSGGDRVPAGGDGCQSTLRGEGQSAGARLNQVDIQ